MDEEKKKICVEDCDCKCNDENHDCCGKMSADGDKSADDEEEAV